MQQHLENVVIVSIKTRIWSGRAKLRPEDLNGHVDLSALPTDEVVSLGSKKLVDPKELHVFNRFKNRAQREAEKLGMRFLDGYAIPKDKLDQLAERLREISSEFEGSRRHFLDRYQDLVHEWLNAHPEMEAALRRSIRPVDEVAALLQFRFSVFEINGIAGVGDLDTEVSGMGDSLLGEIASEAEELLERSFMGRDKISRRVISAIRRLRDKLDGFVFLDGAIQPMVTTIDDLLGRLPKNGPIEGSSYNEVFGLVMLLSDPQRVRDHAHGLVSSQDMMPVPATAVTEEDDSIVVELSDSFDTEVPEQWEDDPLPDQQDTAVGQAGFYF